MSGATRYDTAPRIDATNLAGLTSLMNPQNIDKKINLKNAEKAIMGIQEVKNAPRSDPVMLYDAELKRLADEIGIDLVTDIVPAPAPAPVQRTFKSRKGLGISDLIDDIDMSDVADVSESGGASGAESDDVGETNEEFGSDDESDNESADESQSDNVDDIIAQVERDLGINTDGVREDRRHKIQLASSSMPIVKRRIVNRGTDDQEKQRHINSIVSDIRGNSSTTFGVEHERIQDIKASKLEQIGVLRMTLEEEGIDCEAVTTPTAESPMGEIDSVLGILRLKNDRNRYSSLAEEVLLGFAEGLATVFDGSRAVPIFGWRPDYTDYHNTVNVKLHRMRFETSQVVGNIIQKYNIGPTSRIVMELLPSFFLYPRQRSKERGTLGLSSEPHIADARGAHNAIRNRDMRGSTDEALAV